MKNNMFNDQAAKKRRTTTAIAALFLLLWAVVIFGNLFVCADKTAIIHASHHTGESFLRWDDRTQKDIDSGAK
jgi:hypothetical protein